MRSKVAGSVGNARLGWRVGILLATIAAAGGGETRGAEAGPSPMDEPLRLVQRAAQSYAAIQDYACLFVKREQIGGQLGPDNIIHMKVKTQPFSVCLQWQAPRDQEGQEVIYVLGGNGGNMRVKPAGGLRLLGFISMDPNDPRAMKNSRHPITQAGLGSLIERLAKGWAQEKLLNVTQVKTGTYEYARRRCTRVETIHSANPGQQLSYYRTVVYFDQETSLPIRVENYDWPRFQDDPGQMLEMYSYVNLQLNVGLPDTIFRR